MDRIYIDRGWTFFPEYSEELKTTPGEGQIVDVPHTTKEVPFNYFDEHEYQALSCYQKVIVPDPSWQGKSIKITFDAIGHESEIFLNGDLIADKRCGYTAVSADISKRLRFDTENLITVKVNSNEDIKQPPFGFVVDYMTYGGIYRDVYLTIQNPVHIADAFYKPSAISVNTANKTVEEIQNLKGMGTLQTELILSQEAADILQNGRLSVNQYLDGKMVLGNAPIREPKVSTAIDNISLWDIESPKVYNAVTELLLDGEVVDTFSATIGFREAVFQKDGFYLNGRKIKLRGLNRHQSYPYVGYAMPESMQRYDARILKNELGVNIVRTSHYPQSHDFIDECDRLGLMVFTEMPGWQHIGDEAWQALAIENTKDMVRQYRNHPSIIIWGVRINESEDNNQFYEKTNAAAHALDPTRPTGGVRNRTADKHTIIHEDVMTYNDFSHCGDNAGCMPKNKVTNDMEKAYLITENNGHMFPTKSQDPEDRRKEHMLRHANVLNAVAGEEDISGSIAWCMFDYNTHKEFGSGDRICYHGVMDMFRNKKLAADLYAALGSKETVLAVSSTMDIGEHNASNRGDTYILSNADSVRMYKNNVLIKEYTAEDSVYPNLKNGPILINDYVGNQIVEQEGFSKRKAELVKYILNTFSMNGGKFTFGILWAAFRLMLFHGIKIDDAVPLYQKYIGDWGGDSKQYRFDAVKDGKVVKSLIKEPMTKRSLDIDVSSTELFEDRTYDVAAIRIRACDENNNVLNFFNESAVIRTEGPIDIIGPKVVPLRGGMAGTYIKTKGVEGDAKVIIELEGAESKEVSFKIEKL